MAEERIPEIPVLDLHEVEEIERLVEEEEEKERAEQERRKSHPLKKYLNLKVLLGAGAALALLWVVGEVILQWVENSGKKTTVTEVAPAPDKGLSGSEFQVQKPNIYPLKPFFIPILHKKRETGKFLHVTAHLVLSNRRLHKDIDKVRPLIRQSIYSLLSRKKAKDLVSGGVALEQSLKKAIRVDSNSYLLSGAGTITRVVFTEFIVTPS